MVRQASQGGQAGVQGRSVHDGGSQGRATEEEALSSGRAPSSRPPDTPSQYTEEFDKVADLYLGGLWSKMEAALHGAEGEGKRVDVQLEHDAMKLSLPDGGKITITKASPHCRRKPAPAPAQKPGSAWRHRQSLQGAEPRDPGSQSLVVHSNLHDFYGSDGTDSEVPFRLQRDKTWEMDGEELHEFIEDGLAKHLKVQSLLNTLNVLKRRLNQLQREGLYTKEDLEHHKHVLDDIDARWRDEEGTFAGRLAAADPKTAGLCSRLFNECFDLLEGMHHTTAEMPEDLRGMHK
ncbi:hypothetical protein CHLNCDRAFT_134457 [Chlorella variabilis]|uniref:Uncharacterized protein n=1 Tax=Chlorella variabilis TaxID=554065 RepID=E1ZG10_CHLVA|nr:hypothetical protein CHLNCDRAFT_134457 [Chlorella variabilis]EFN55215.1 hypothetical protein CHLNCDRAFT_134457 [Chlorella variabilis]|eukprot:XP_005847317.1 hypothetical protein CHLNCDRAFT_134457 [Chlorella variabilis]